MITSISNLQKITVKFNNPTFVVNTGGAGTTTWGSITGTLSNQTDLQNALDAKADKTNVLELDNTTPYTPTQDFHPATKEYVDNSAGAVDSVNGQTGVVVLDADDIDDTTTVNKFVTAVDLVNLSNLSGVNTGDVTVTDTAEIDLTLAGQDISGSLVNGSISEARLNTTVNASLDLADTSLQPGDNISQLTNDVGYTTYDSTDFDIDFNGKTTDDLTEGATNLYFSAAEQSKLAGIENNADVTDETNVVDALDGATLPTAVLSSVDKVLIQDVDDSDNLKTVTAQDIANLAPGGSGEANTASNVGTGGTGLFKQKVGVDLEFKNINAGSNLISVTDDVANNEVDIDVNQGNLSITASQVSDFDTEVSNNVDVAANTAARGTLTGVTVTPKDSSFIYDYPGTNAGNDAQGNPTSRSTPQINLNTFQVSNYDSGDSDLGGDSELIRLRASAKKAKPTVAYYDWQDLPVSWVTTHFQPQDLLPYPTFADFPPVGVNDGLNAYYAEDTDIYYIWNTSTLQYDVLPPTDPSYYFRAIHQHYSVETKDVSTPGAGLYSRFIIDYGRDIVVVRVSNSHFKLDGGTFQGKEYGALVTDLGKIYSPSTISLFPSAQNVSIVDLNTDSATDNVFTRNTESIDLRILQPGDGDNITGQIAAAFSGSSTVNKLTFLKDLILNIGVKLGVGINAAFAVDVRDDVGVSDGENVLVRLSKSAAEGSFFTMGYKQVANAITSYFMRPLSNKNFVLGTTGQNEAISIDGNNGDVTIAENLTIGDNNDDVLLNIAGQNGSTAGGTVRFSESAVGTPNGVDLTYNSSNNSLEFRDGLNDVLIAFVYRDGGLKLEGMTTGKRDTITSALGANATGLIIFNTTTGTHQGYNGSSWVDFGAGGGSSPLTTKGDLYTYDTGDARLPVGTDGQILIADSAEATGLKWESTIGFDAAKRSSTSTQAINSTAAPIPWQTELIAGTNITWSAINNTRITVTEGGVFYIGGYVAASSASQRAQFVVEVYINGVATGILRTSSYIRNSGNSWDFWVSEISNEPIELNANDYIELYVGIVEGGTYGYSGANTATLVGDKTAIWLTRANGIKGDQGNTALVQIDQSGGTGDTYGVLAGAIDGVNTTYTVSRGIYSTGNLQVYLNGQLQTQGTNEDWVETSPGAGTFDFNNAPQVGDELTVEYDKTSNPTDTLNFRTVSSTTTQLSTDDLIRCDSASAFTVGLLPAGVWGGNILRIKNINTGIITVDASGSETIDGITTQTLNQFDSITLFSNGTTIDII